ncbi:MAG: SDR family oxidoreductase [Gorillibacterium sp.]|nr:SDR family oxidoreductase [Gorillibacterium sp.]
MNILITGAARGLGYELVKEALARGHRVAAGVRNAVSGCDELRELANNEQAKLLRILPMDVNEETSIAEVKDAITAEWGSLDVIVNNAAILLARDQKIEDLDFSALETTFLTNLYGPMKVIKHFLPLLRKSAQPCILNISSEAGTLSGAYGGDYPYALSKNALTYFTAQLRKELSSQGFKVLALHPGWIRTPMGGEKAPGKPEDAAQGILNLIEGKVTASDALLIDHNGKAMPY